jgi:hypothetical protein
MIDAGKNLDDLTENFASFVARVSASNASS